MGAIYALVRSMRDGETHEGLHNSLYVFLPKAPCREGAPSTPTKRARWH